MLVPQHIVIGSEWSYAWKWRRHHLVALKACQGNLKCFAHTVIQNVRTKALANLLKSPHLSLSPLETQIPISLWEDLWRQELLAPHQGPSPRPIFSCPLGPTSAVRWIAPPHLAPSIGMGSNLTVQIRAILKPAVVCVGLHGLDLRAHVREYINYPGPPETGISNRKAHI